MEGDMGGLEFVLESSTSFRHRSQEISIRAFHMASTSPTILTLFLYTIAISCSLNAREDGSFRVPDCSVFSAFVLDSALISICPLRLRYLAVLPTSLSIDSIVWLPGNKYLEARWVVWSCLLEPFEHSGEAAILYIPYIQMPLVLQRISDLFVCSII